MRPRPEDLYRTIRLIRRFEERAIDLVRSGEIVSGIHPCIGQEAVAVGIGAALRRDDVMMANHRSHGHMLAKGTDPGRLLAELAGRTTGVARARGGSFHPSDFSVGVLGCSGTVGHGAPLAAGAAWALAQEGAGADRDRFFGDGAVNQGALLESFNLAVAMAGARGLRLREQPLRHHVAGGDRAWRARSPAGPRPSASRRPVVTAWTPNVVFDATAAAVARARAGEGPSFLEFSTLPVRGPSHLRAQGQAALPRRRRGRRAGAPATRWSWQAAGSRRRGGGQIDEQVEADVEAAVRFALDSPKPEPADALDYLYASGLRPRGGVPGTWNGRQRAAGRNG